jgi:hypothetical protein
MRRGIVTMMLFAATGCGGGEYPARQQQPPPTRSVTAPQPPGSPALRTHLARPGTVCGHVATLTRAPARVIVVRGRTTCVEALRVFRRYFDPGTPAEGTAGLIVIGRWTCGTRNTVTTCVSRTATVHARA